jgi:cytochrome c peroxidase
MKPSPAELLRFRTPHLHVITTLIAAIASVITAPVCPATDQQTALPTLDPSAPGLRMPIDAAVHDNVVFTANSRSGSITAVDQSGLNVVSEWKVADSLSAVESTGRLLLALDDSAGRLLVLKPDPAARELKLLSQHPLPMSPVDLAVSSDGGMVAVSSLWSASISLLALDSAGIPHLQAEVPLPFSPRRVLFSDCCTVIVADSFGGQLAAVDATSGNILKNFSVHGHNIRGLAVNARTNSLLVSCQTLDSSTFTTYERVFWGVLMQNGLHSIPLQDLFSAAPQASFIKSSAERHEFQQGGNYTVNPDAVASAPAYAQTSGTGRSTYPLGTPSIGSGDPGTIAVTHTDATVLVLSGTGQVAFRTASHLPFERIHAGKRPESICLSADQKLAFVVNRFEDSVTVISLQPDSAAVRTTVALAPIRPLTQEEIGEQAFYDARISLDGWYSCHSCHTDGHTNGMLADTFGDEDRGAPKKVSSLLGVATTGPWAWNGSKKQLEEQVHTSLLISMQSQLSTEQLPIEPIAAWLRTLQPAPGLAAARRQLPDPQTLLQARLVFKNSGCSNCHAGTALTSATVFDVGIHDEQGETEFNPPGLAGVSQRGPWFHDGRASSLEDVLRSGHHDPTSPLNDSQIRLLLMLLETL